VPGGTKRRPGPDGTKKDALIYFGFSEISLDGPVETGLLRFGPVPLQGRLAIVTNAGRDAVDAGGASGPVTGESSKETVKTLARGMPGEPV
jgi:hypothetical protein